MRGPVVAVALLLIAPLLLVDVPPLLDYPNHLARIFLLARGAADPALAPTFTANWALIPDLGIDIVGIPLMRLFPPHVAGRLILGVVILIPYAGVLALNRALFGRVQPWALACALVIPAGAYLEGFLNFVAGLGGALLLTAYWIANPEAGPRRLVLAMLGTTVLFFVHLMGALFALALVAAWEFPSPRRLVRAAPLAVPPLLLYALAPLHGVAAAPTWLGPAQKLAQLLIAVTAYNRPLDLATAAAIVLFPAVCAATFRLDVPRGMRLALAGTALAYVASPYAFKGTQSLDTRFIFLAALLLFAVVRPARLPPWARRAALAAFATILLARTAALADAWHSRVADLAQFRAVIAGVAPGDKVFVAAIRPEEDPGYWSRTPPGRRFSNGIPADTQLGALLPIERRAFFPLLFNYPSQQPFRLTPPYQHLADLNVGVIPLSWLDPRSFCGFDKFLLLDAGALRPGQLPAGWLQPIAARDAAALYRITPPAGSGCATPG